ncbi:MAG: hypothetical protein ABEK10_00250 [Candidatus Nanosalina sp.]
MKDLVKKLGKVKGVKNVKNRGGKLKINLYAREKGEFYNIKGDLRKISQKLRNRLDTARENSVITAWNWVQKPEKKYTETRLDTEKVNDRKPSGHKPPYYTVSVRK